MNSNDFFVFFREYGTIFLFTIIFLEHLNLPGLPAGMVMPAIGVLVSQSEINYFFALFLSVIAGLLGSIVLYAMSYLFGITIIKQLSGKYKKFDTMLDTATNLINTRKGVGVFICRIMPVVRTIVSIPAGLLKFPFIRFVFLSIPGIFLWNTTLISAGYFFSYYFI